MKRFNSRKRKNNTSDIRFEYKSITIEKHQFPVISILAQRDTVSTCVLHKKNSVLDTDTKVHVKICSNLIIKWNQSAGSNYILMSVLMVNCKRRYPQKFMTYNSRS